MAELIFRGGVIITLNADMDIAVGDVAIRDGEIVHVGNDYTPQDADFHVLDCQGCIVMPGLIQSHTHLCQTLARGSADNLELLPWLEKRIWPYEAALEYEDLAASARLGCLELLLGGTTSVLDMGTVHHTDAIFEAARDSGLRATIGKAMMDMPGASTPEGLRETTQASLDESDRLCESWHGQSQRRLQYAYAPRFALSCTRELLVAAGQQARARGARLHTHASENKSEIESVRALTGMSNIEYLASVGLVGADVALAHCIWLSDAEKKIVRDTGTHVLHCPSSNLKLASGIAQIPEMLAEGISVSLGADGPPCANNLDAFMEMRLAALIHKPRVGPKAMPAHQVLRLATMGGARALGIEKEVGSIELAKRGDVIAVRVNTPHIVPTPDPYSAMVYAAKSSDVKHVSVDGALVVQDSKLQTMDVEAVLADAHMRAAEIRHRMPK